MRKQELAQIISDRLNQLDGCDYSLDSDSVIILINALLREIFISISEGRTVSIRGFGTFKPKQYKGNLTSEKFLPNRASSANNDRPMYFARPTFKPGTILRNEIK